MIDLVDGLLYVGGGALLIALDFVLTIIVCKALWRGLKAFFHQLSITRPIWPMEGPPVL